jgi:(p)ppGpp synthase/HD superfamily hydrolase
MRKFMFFLLIFLVSSLPFSASASGYDEFKQRQCESNLTSKSPLSRSKFEELYALATTVAMEAHKNQFYDRYLPYHHHLEAVEEVLLAFGYDPSRYPQARLLILGAWLHDVVEDTAVSLQTIQSLFGPEVAGLVAAITKPRQKWYWTKNQRLRVYWKQLSLNRLSVTLKLADRIANLEYGLLHNQVVQRYLDTYSEFRTRLYRAGEEEAMWGRLDALIQEALAKRIQP